jgi:hypothetical protein
LPLRVEDGCRSGLGRNLVEAAVLLVDVLFAKLAVSFLVVTPHHVVLVLMPGASLDLLLLRFSLLGRGFLPILILLLLSLVLLITLLLSSSFVIILDSCGLLEV